jgi:transcriptional regulator with XRE-family HTH domain
LGNGKESAQVSEVRSPTVRRRELGALLRTLRNDRGLTVEQVATQLLCSPSKVSRMETGQRGATARDVRDLCDIYEVTDVAQREHLARLAAEGKQQGWWQAYELDYFATYVGLEEAAKAVRGYQSSVIPGLLQTPEYARAMAEVVVPAVTSSRVDELVEVKMRRQSVLAKKPPLPLSLILDEAVLHRVVGGPAAMRAQLDHLIEVTKLYKVTIRVIPYSAGAHPALESTFSILDFDDPIPSVVYVEGLVGFIYIERAQDIARYERVFDNLCEIALDPKESLKVIAKASEQYSGATGDTAGSS